MSANPLLTSPMLSASRAAPKRSRFYIGMAILMLVVVVAGFWPPYYGPLLRGETLRPFMQFWGIQVHAAFCLGWLLCFLIQAVLVERGRIDLHRRVGGFMAVYGAVVVIVGTWCGFAIALIKMAHGVPLDAAAGFLFIPLSDMVVFAGFLAAAIVYRKKPELHKRLMLLAALTLAIVGNGRLVMHLFPALLGTSRWLFGIVWLIPLWIAMGYDLLTRRRVHLVYFIGLALFAPRVNIDVFMRTEIWRSVGRALLQQFL